MPEKNGKPWNGEGLPPVGTTCEALSARTSTFRQCAVLAHRGGMAVVSFLDQEELQWATEFRSADKAAADARDSAINLMIGHVKDHPGGRHGAPHLTQLKIQEEACRDLYDAGYRKEVTA